MNEKTFNFCYLLALFKICRFDILSPPQHFSSRNEILEKIILHPKYVFTRQVL